MLINAFSLIEEKQNEGMYTQGHVQDFGQGVGPGLIQDFCA